MPVQKRAIHPAQFSELLNLFPCPAWIEDFSGQILADNTHLQYAKNRHPLKPVVYPLPLAINVKKLRLVALLPSGLQADYQHRIISALLAKTLLSPHSATADESRLTPREREICRELAHGYSYKTIADHLGISHEVVRQHVTHARQKLGASRVPLLRRRT